MNSTIQLVIVGGVIAVAVGVIIAVSIQQTAQIERQNKEVEEHTAYCDNWFNDL